jgi:hypothetical protein
MQHQLPQIPLLRSRHPNPQPLEPPLHQQSQQMLGVARIRLLLPGLRRPNRRRIADPQLHPQLRQQPFEPARMPTGLHAYSHRLAPQRAVELFGLLHVLQPPLAALSSFRVHHCNLLKPRVIITAYNPHVGSFSRALVVAAKQLYSGLGADLVMKSLREVLSKYPNLSTDTYSDLP